MEAQFKELTFKTDKEWKQWLEENTHKRIQFKDNGQDLMVINVSETGEIIDCNMQSMIWNGRFVNLKKIEPDKAIRLWNPISGGKWKTYDFIIESVQTFLKK